MIDKFNFHVNYEKTLTRLGSTALSIFDNAVFQADKCAVLYGSQLLLMVKAKGKT